MKITVEDGSLNLNLSLSLCLSVSLSLSLPLSLSPSHSPSFPFPPVAVRASITGWLTLHHQTKLVIPRGFIRLASVIIIFFVLRSLG